MQTHSRINKIILFSLSLCFPFKCLGILRQVDALFGFRWQQYVKEEGFKSQRLEMVVDAEINRKYTEIR